MWKLYARLWIWWVTSAQTVATFIKNIKFLILSFIGLFTRKLILQKFTWTFIPIMWQFSKLNFIINKSLWPVQWNLDGSNAILKTTSEYQNTDQYKYNLSEATIIMDFKPRSKLHWRYIWMIFGVSGPTESNSNLTLHVLNLYKIRITNYKLYDLSIPFGGA